MRQSPSLLIQLDRVEQPVRLTKRGGIPPYIRGTAGGLGSTGGIRLPVFLGNISSAEIDVYDLFDTHTRRPNISNQSNHESNSCRYKVFF